MSKMTIVYIDILFLINGITTYILLDISSKLSGAFLRRKCHIGASLLSGLMGVIVFFAPSGLFIGIFTRVFICITIVSAAFRPDIHDLLRLCGIFFITSLCMGGIVMLLAMGSVSANGLIYFNMTGAKLFAGFFIGYIVFNTIMGRKSMAKECKIVTVEALFGEKCLKFAAMADTGNLLREPVTGMSVILVSPEIMNGLEIENRCYPVPMGTASDNFSLIYAYKPDELMINGKRRDEYMVGKSACAIRGVGQTRGIIGGNVWDL
ncbi:MAG: sigma-E processing peptidase SpoIIGA [Clostridia bacterium]|nr:sigma-E processing peptidase SpoIIGA [Clostridia bacterium]